MTESHFNYKSGVYYFRIKGEEETLTITEENLSVLLYLYSNLGGNRSQNDLSEIFDLPKKYIKEIIKACSFTKTSPLILPVDLCTIGKDRITFVSQDNLLKFKALSESFCKEKEEDRLSQVIGPTFTEEIVTESIRCYDDSVFIINLSDWHIGRLVDSPGLVPFSYKILKERVGRILEEIKLYSRIYSPRKIFVNFLGDLIDGPLANMHKNQGLCQEFSSYEQIDKARSLILFLLREIHEHYSCPIEVYAVPGNHDRVTTDKSEDTEFIAHSSIFNTLRDSLRVESIALHKVDGVYRWNSYQVNDEVRCIMYHGDNALNAQKLLNADMRYGAEYKIVVRGHEHRRLFNESGRNFAEIVNPSLIGNTEFGYYENAYITRPGQSLVIIAPKNGVQSVQCIWLDC